VNIKAPECKSRTLFLMVFLLAAFPQGSVFLKKIPDIVSRGLLNGVKPRNDISETDVDR